MYKIIDGVLYQQVDTSDIKEKINSVVRDVKPYQQAIEQVDNKIESLNRQRIEYKAQIDKIVAQAGLDADLVKQLDPDNAFVLGF
jgi:FtsZ-binding cell division protein ZapB